MERQPRAEPVHDAPSAEVLADDADWWRIYEASFPSDEREPPDVILGSLRAGVGAAVRTRVDGVTVGLATVHLLRTPPAVFLVYLAVDGALRNSGLGPPIFEAAWTFGAAAHARAGRQALGFVWECEDPALAHVPDDVERRRRRIAWFERRGGRVLDATYIQPPVDGVNPVPMRLLWRGAPDPDVPALIRAIYDEKYGAANGISAATLADLRARIGL